MYGEIELPFYRILNNANAFNWDEAYQKAFSELKRHLSNSPLLVSSIENEKLFMYLSYADAYGFLSHKGYV